MMLIDTHCHLDFSVFDEDRELVIADAEKAGVSLQIVPGVNAEGWQRLLLLSNQYQSMLPALGLHPCFLDEHLDEHLSLLEQFLEKEKVCAVGEIGLDFFIQNPDKERQLFFFDAQLELAKQHHLPVILHVRKAHDQVLKLLRRKQLSRAGVVHAFSGSEQQARQYIELGFKLGIGGTLTYERAKKLRRIVSEFPIESFLLETDSPDMPLADFRGQRNQPARVLDVARVMAEIREIDIKQVAQVTTTESKKLFGLV